MSIWLASICLRALAEDDFGVKQVASTADGDNQFGG